MGRRKQGEPPRYRLHKQSGQAVVSLPLGGGRYRDVLLGPYNTPESRQQYARVLAEWLSSAHAMPQDATPAGLSVNELVLRFLPYAAEHYRRPDGSVTTEPAEYRRAFRPLCHLYGLTPAAAFGPLRLKAVRELMANGYTHPRHGEQAALARGVVNQRVGRVRRLFRWAVENELTPPAVLQGLEAVKDLQSGRSQARETEPVRPVAVDVVEQTCARLNRFLAGLVRLQLYTGARPGELCVLRPCDLDTTGEVWLYRPQAHKTRHHGHGRVIAIGPRGQAVLRPLLPLGTHDYVFSAARAKEEYHQDRKEVRRTPLTPSQRARVPMARPRRRPGPHYTPGSYAQAIRKTCLKHGLPPWHPNQLRHAAATEIRKEFGLEAAQVVLGHTRADVTQVYAERNLTLAEKIARQIG